MKINIDYTKGATAINKLAKYLDGNHKQEEYFEGELDEKVKKTAIEIALNEVNKSIMHSIYYLDELKKYF